MNLKADLSRTVEGALVAGANVVAMASAVGVTPRQIADWRNGVSVPEKHRAALQSFAVQYVLNEIARVGRASVEQPKLAANQPFLDHLNELNLAHWLVFGQSFLSYLQQWEREQTARGES